MESTSPLVLTKICLPALRQELVTRSRLIDLLEAHSGRGFVLVSAPAGYGKTTLLLHWAQYLHRDGAAVAWYALDAADDEALLFATYLVAAMQQALGTLPELEQLATLLRSSAETNLQDIVQSLINVVLSTECDCLLLLDDYHLITSPAVHMALVYLLEHLPPNMRIVLGSRADPPFPLARMRAQAHLLELRAAHLRFDDDETLQFLNGVMKLDVSLPQAEALLERTEGWAAGLQLAALSLAGQAGEQQDIASFSGSHRFLLEYLLEEVVARQTPQVQQFLLVTSLLDRMCAPLCDALTGKESGSDEILAYLFQANLFVVALDGEGLWYRYHHLFRDSLQARLLKDRPDDVPRLHRAASEWLAQQQYLREAARHAFAVGDWEYAAAFVERHAFTMLLYSEIALIHEWCAAFPEEVMQRHALLCILQSWTLVFRYRRRNRALVEERLSLAGRIVASMTPGRQADELREHIAVVRTFLSMAPDVQADAQELLQRSNEMLTAYPEGDPGRFSALLTTGYAYMALNELQPAVDAITAARQAAVKGRLYFGIVESSFHLARIAHMQGQMQQAERMCRDTLQEVAALLPEVEQQLPAAGCLKIALGCVLLEQDRLDEALELLLEGLQLAGTGTNPYYLLTACTALARLYRVQGRLEEAGEALARLEERWPDIGFCTQVLRLDMALQAHPEDAALTAEAQDWQQRNRSVFSDSAPLPGMGPYGAAEAFYLTRMAWMRILLRMGETERAGPLLEDMQQHYQECGMTGRVGELSTLRALADEAQGEKSALQPVPSGNAVAINALLEELSERELEVLQLMAQGATNRKIAGTLVITVGTVKSHINHILRKLEASNRTEAVARARRLGLPGI